MGASGAVYATLALAGLTAACGGEDGGEDLTPFEIVREDQRAALLSVWADGPDDAWAVGGENRRNGGDDLGPLVLHKAGDTWEELDSGLRGVDLWWVHGFAGGPIFMGGTQGTIVRYEDGAFTTMATPGNGTVFGIWGATPDDVWAVGGGGSGFAWRYQDGAWAAVEVPEDIRESGGAIWKIAGRAADDVWMTGTIGFTSHFDGTAWSRLDVPADVSLFGVACDGERFISSGGDPAIVVENEGDGWVQAELPADTLLLSGMAMAEGRPAYAVGRSGTIVRKGDDGWVLEAAADVPTIQSLHAAAYDSSGGLWVVGGLFEAPDTDLGVLLHRPAVND